MSEHRVSYRLYSWRTERAEKQWVTCPTYEAALAVKEVLEGLGAAEIGISGQAAEEETAARQTALPSLGTDEVWVALWKDRTCIGDFLTEPIDGAAAAHLARLIGQYNRFEPERVSQAIGSCPPLWKFEIGRAGSPVLYVTVTSKVGNAPVQARERVDSLFARANPDEVSWPTGLNHGRVRLWWD